MIYTYVSLCFRFVALSVELVEVSFLLLTDRTSTEGSHGR